LIGNTTFDGGTIVVDGTNNIINSTGASENLYAGFSERSFFRNNTYMPFQTGMSAPIATGLALSVSNIRYYAFITPSKRLTIDVMGFTVTTANASSKCNMAIYNDTGSTAPSTLKANGTEKSLSTNSFLNWTINKVTFKSNSLYWIAFQCNASTTARTGNFENRFLPNVLGYNVAANGSIVTNYGLSATYNGTFSNTATASINTESGISVPAFAFRVRTDGEGTII
jgi:hypothetical protein